MCNKYRGRKDRPTYREAMFWNEFPELLMDDPEDKNNELIRLLRDTAQDYFKGKGRGLSKTISIFNIALLINRVLKGETCAYLTLMGNVMLIREDIYNEQLNRKWIDVEKEDPKTVNYLLIVIDGSVVYGYWDGKHYQAIKGTGGSMTVKPTLHQPLPYLPKMV